MNAKKTTIQVGAILDSNKAFDAYHDSTGKVPPKMPKGKNTMRIPFVAKTDGGNKAALLVNQTGFEETADEIARGEESSGLSVFIALDAPTIEEGHALLIDWSERLLWPEQQARARSSSAAKAGSTKSEAKSAAARRNGKKGGRPRNR